MSQAPASIQPKAAEHIGIDGAPFVNVSETMAVQLLHVDRPRPLSRAVRGTKSRREPSNRARGVMSDLSMD
jgi:hypothetical protein